MNTIKKLAVLMALVASFNMTALVWADDEGAKQCPLPKASAEHVWLKQMVGEWKAKTEMYMPEKPAMVSEGTESVRAIGEFWTSTEVKGTMMDMPFVGNMTIGFNADKKKYVATWIDSMSGKLWEYEGSVDESGKVLTLETEGECPMNPGKKSKFKETLEIKDADHKVFTSRIKGDDGEWVTMMRSEAVRVK
jgi:hypothetical protein